MQKIYKKNLLFNTEKIVLSSESRIFKTSNFIKITRNLKGLDGFLSKIAEGIVFQLPEIEKAFFETAAADKNLSFRLETVDKAHSFEFRFGFQTHSCFDIDKKDIIFVSYSGKEKIIRKNDQRLNAYAKSRKNFDVNLLLEKHNYIESDYTKIYLLANSDYVNFPLLNDKQKKLVEIEDKNVIVQGVAGSGKTNVCIDKIIYSACRAYSGRILYTTYSRGLLVDTQEKVKIFENNLANFITNYRNGDIIFVDNNHKKAIENKLGIYFSIDKDEQICEKIQQIITFLDKQVDYFLLEDIYSKFVGKSVQVVGEDFFVKTFLADLRNHQLSSKLSKLKGLSYEIIYKEIFGLIFGSYDLENPRDMLSLDDYLVKRADGFAREECEIIYLLAQDYAKYLAKNNLFDNNSISRELLAVISNSPQYSLSIVDETQDMTEVNLCLLKKLSRKMFCLGDALQMINPSYFSFAYIKRLLYEKDLTAVAELSHNYRNTKKIVEIISQLCAINEKQFGTHSFVWRGESVDSDVKTRAVYVAGQNFVNALSRQNIDNFTVIVSTKQEKDELRKSLKTQEILTVSEVKGLERDTVLLYNVLSKNIDKWRTLERVSLNRKQADENSVFRYYFNLFYVGVSRAKINLYVCEDEKIQLFDEFFADNFTKNSPQEAINGLADAVGRAETEQEELLDRVEQFVKLEQFDNARFTANKINDDIARTYWLNKTDIAEKFILHGNYR
ncbi:MAG: 3'-5' exonuclease, partial [Clostridia bacterium]